MDFNPLTRICAEIQKQVDQLQQSEKQGADELQWYGSIEPRALTEDLRRNEAEIEKLQLEIQALEDGIHESSGRLGEIEPVIGTLLNPFNWFATDQVDLRRTRAQLHEAGCQKAALKPLKEKELEDLRARISEMMGDLQRHDSFDMPGRERDLSMIRQNIARKKEILRFVAAKKRRVDETLAPLMEEIQHLNSKWCRAKSDLEAAQSIDRQLSAAGSGKERAMLHEQCERRFGVGSPRKIVFERQKEILQIERDFDKARRRAKEMGQKAARRIDTIVIDGNNLCYEGSTFIALSAIETLVPILARNYAVVVVFDSAIRRLLNSDDSQIRNRLGSQAKVHIVASRQSADETVLDLASENKFTYVLSNDRFGDFNEKAAVKDGRMIRHEIVKGNVYVHDLQLRAAYLPGSKESRH